jgi:alkylation response protein AidB-like acyl-CoA dehydrogenase
MMRKLIDALFCALVLVLFLSQALLWSGHMTQNDRGDYVAIQLQAIEKRLVDLEAQVDVLRERVLKNALMRHEIETMGDRADAFENRIENLRPLYVGETLVDSIVECAEKVGK